MKGILARSVSRVSIVGAENICSKSKSGYEAALKRSDRNGGFIPKYPDID